MSRLYIFIIALSFSFTSLAQTCKVLFIGNSYTYVNSLPELISSMYAASGDEFEYVMSAPGGCTFQQHCSVSLPYIQQGGWDYVVLQEQSQLPSFPEAQFMQDSYPYAAELCSLIRQYNPQAHILFYMTWGRKNGDAQNCPYYPPLCTYEGMDSLLRARYLLMSEDNEACVSPVGALWHFIRDQYPEMELYQSDESHPSYFGSYVAACSFYTSLTGRNPLEISWNGSLDESSAMIAKIVAKNVAYDSLSKWCFHADTVQDDSTAIVSYPALNFSVYPNPANNRIYVHTSNFDNPFLIVIMDLKGNILYQRSDVTKDEAIDVSFLSDGSYLLSVRDGLHQFTKILNIVR